jgi:hypothetical protein
LGIPINSSFPMTLIGGASLEGLVRQWPGYVLVDLNT